MTANVTGMVLNWDEELFTEAIGDMYMLEVLYRGRGDLVNADRLMNIRIRLKESVGLKTKTKEDNKSSE